MKPWSHLLKIRRAKWTKKCGMPFSAVLWNGSSKPPLSSRSLWSIVCKVSMPMQSVDVCSRGDGSVRVHNCTRTVSQNQCARCATEAGFTSDDILANQQQQCAGISTCACNLPVRRRAELQRTCLRRMQGRSGMPQRAMMNNAAGGGGMPNNHPALSGGGPPR